jgi:hypothetical protein
MILKQRSPSALKPCSQIKGQKRDCLLFTASSASTDHLRVELRPRVLVEKIERALRCSIQLPSTVTVPHGT